MVAPIYRCLFALANFFGLFCFTCDEKKLKISRLKLVLNILKAFVPQLLFCYIILDVSAQKYIYGTDYWSLTEFSGFSLIIFGSEYILEHCIASVLVLLHLLRRDQILKFFNHLKEIKISIKLENKLKNRIKTLLLCATVFGLFSNIFQMVCSIEISPERVLIYAIVNLSFFIYLSFVVFAKIAGSFTEILLDDLLIDLQKALQSKSRRRIQDVSVRYEHIVEINNQFHSIFGDSMNIVFCYLSLRTTSEVTSKFSKNFQNL